MFPLKNSLRVAFAGTPEISSQVLQGLIEKNYNIVGVFTQPDRLKGRGKKLQRSSVKSLAILHSIQVFQPLSFNDHEARSQLVKLKADIMIVIAYGLLLPLNVLDIPKYGCINIHVSLLPRWRGAAPIQRAIEAGDCKTGITIIKMNAKLDAGDILHTVETPILSTDTNTSLHNRLGKLSIPAVCTVLEKIASGIPLIYQTQQNANAIYASKLTKQEGSINFDNTCFTIDCKVRAFNPWPGTYIEFEGIMVKFNKIKILNQFETSYSNIPSGMVIKIDKTGLQIQVSDGIMCIESLQFPGKKMQPVSALLHGRILNNFNGKILKPKTFT